MAIKMAGSLEFDVVYQKPLNFMKNNLRKHSFKMNANQAHSIMLKRVFQPIYIENIHGASCKALYSIRLIPSTAHQN